LVCEIGTNKIATVRNDEGGTRDLFSGDHQDLNASGIAVSALQASSQQSPSWIASKNVLPAQEAIHSEIVTDASLSKDLAGDDCASDSLTFSNTKARAARVNLITGDIDNRTILTNGEKHAEYPIELQTAHDELAELQKQVQAKQSEILQIRSNRSEFESTTQNHSLSSDAGSPSTCERGVLQGPQLDSKCSSLLSDSNAATATSRAFWSLPKTLPRRADGCDTGMDEKHDEIGDSSDDELLPRRKKSRLVRKKQINRSPLPRVYDDEVKSTPVGPPSRNSFDSDSCTTKPCDSLSDVQQNSLISLKTGSIKKSAENGTTNRIAQKIGVASDPEIPRSLRIPEKSLRALKWNHVWKELETMKWTVSKGKGLDDFYYYRPGLRDATKNKKHQTTTLLSVNVREGIPHFNRQSDVIDYIVKEAIPYKVCEGIVDSGKDGQCPNSNSHPESESEAEFSVGKHPAAFESADLPSDHRAKNENKAEIGSIKESDALSYERWASCNVQTMKWVDIWSRLQDEGWSWDHGSGLITTFYLMPGVSSKRHGVLGVSMFSSEDDVKSHLIRLYQSCQNETSMKCDPVDCLDHGPTLTEWNLVAHRTRRIQSPCGVGTASPASSKCASTPSNVTRRAVRSGGLPNKRAASKMEAERTGRLSSPSSGQARKYTRRRHHPSIEPKPSTSTELPLHVNESGSSGIKSSSLDGHNGQKKPYVTPSPAGLRVSTSTIASPSTKSVSRRHIGISSNRKIFTGLNFLMTGLPESSSVYNTATMTTRIHENGGAILESEKELVHPISGRVGKRAATVLIAAPAAFRRPKFLTALSAGIPIVHPMWLLESLSQSSRLPFTQFLLPAGSSPLHPYFVFRDGDERVDDEVCAPIFDPTYPFLNLAGPMWASLLENAGAKFCSGSPASVVTYRKILVTMAFADLDCSELPSYVVVDSYAYSEGELSHSQVDFLHSCQSISNSRTSNQKGKFRVVTTEWVAFCLRVGEYVDPGSSATFHLPRDPARHPLATRGGALPVEKRHVSAGNSKSERYVVGDVVSYDSGEIGAYDPTCHKREHRTRSTLAYARIVEFFRKDRCGKISVRLQLLERNSSQLSLSTSVSSFKIIASSSLRGRLTVFSSRAYFLLPYAKDDDSILYSSPEWEEQSALGSKTERIVKLDKISPTGAPSKSMKTQLSQDY